MSMQQVVHACGKVGHPAAKANKCAASTLNPKWLPASAMQVPEVAQLALEAVAQNYAVVIGLQSTGEVRVLLLAARLCAVHASAEHSRRLHLCGRHCSGPSTGRGSLVLSELPLVAAALPQFGVHMGLGALIRHAHLCRCSTVCTHSGYRVMVMSMCCAGQHGLCPQAMPCTQFHAVLSWWLRRPTQHLKHGKGSNML